MRTLQRIPSPGCAAPPPGREEAERLAEPRDMAEYRARYENIALVGSGTYGSVFHAKERATGRPAAAKARYSHPWFLISIGLSLTYCPCRD